MPNETPKSPLKGYGYHLTDEAILNICSGLLKPVLLAGRGQSISLRSVARGNKIREQFRKGDVKLKRRREGIRARATPPLFSSIIEIDRLIFVPFSPLLDFAYSGLGSLPVWCDKKGGCAF